MNLDSCTATSPTPPLTRSQGLRALLQSTRPRLVGLVSVTALSGYMLARPLQYQWAIIAWTCLGTMLSAAGANSMNQWMERRRDLLMRRTRHRPMAAGAMRAEHGLSASVGMIVAGTLLLWWTVNELTALLAALAAAIYLLAYTPLKTRSSLCTLVGAVCGALPPMMGWSAATGTLDYGAWILGLLLFLWQIPHFLSLAWLFREDYARGGYRMLPVIDSQGRITFKAILLSSMALIAVAPAFVLAGLGGRLLIGGTLIAGLALTVAAAWLYQRRSEPAARRFFLITNLYLPTIFILILLDKVWPAL